MSCTLFPGVALITGASSGKLYNPSTSLASHQHTNQASVKQQQQHSPKKAAPASYSPTSPKPP